jgi:hypothetical protein
MACHLDSNSSNGYGLRRSSIGKLLTLNHEWTRMKTNSQKNVATRQLSPSWLTLFVAWAATVGKAHRNSSLFVLIRG